MNRWRSLIAPGVMVIGTFLKSVAFLFSPLTPWPPFLLIAGLVLWWSGVAGLLTSRRGWFAVFLCESLGHLLMLFWLPFTIVRYSNTPVFLAWVVIGLLGGYLALYGLIPIAGVFLERRTNPSGLLVFCLAWGGYVCRAWLLTGFPWGEFSAVLARWTPWVQIADVVGTHGLSALILMWTFWLGWPGRYRLRRTVLALGLLLLSLGYGMIRIGQAPKFIDRYLMVRLVQPSIPMDEKLGIAMGRGFDRQVELSRLSQPGGVDLVVWPESAFPGALQPGTEWWQRIQRLQNHNRAYLLAGADRWEWQTKPFLYNSAFLFDPEGRSIDVYDKVHLVPFGEYVPLRQLLPFVDKLVGGIQDFSPGQEYRILRMPDPPIKLGVLICFESVFPHPSILYSRQKADILVGLTNDAWFEHRAGPYQHWMHSQLRAVETRKPLLFVANTGPTLVIDTVGRIQAHMEINRVGYLEQKVATGKAQTVYTFVGREMDGLMAIFALLLLAFGSLVKSRKRHKKT